MNNIETLKMLKRHFDFIPVHYIDVWTNTEYIQLKVKKHRYYEDPIEDNEPILVVNITIQEYKYIEEWNEEYD